MKAFTTPPALAQAWDLELFLALRVVISASTGDHAAMPIAKADTDAGLGCVFTVDGALEDREYRDCLHEHLTDPTDRLLAYRYTIFDLEGLGELRVKTATIRTVATFAVGASKRNPDAVVAFVTPEKSIYGLYRLFDLSMGDDAWETNAFENRHTADAWVRDRVDKKFGIKGLTFAGEP
jgi:hypothetical protein